MFGSFSKNKNWRHQSTSFVKETSFVKFQGHSMFPNWEIKNLF